MKQTAALPRQISPSKLLRTGGLLARPALSVLGFAAICVLLSLFVLDFNSPFIFFLHEQRSQQERYAVVVDAGSTGSRVHVYCFAADTGELCDVGNASEVFRSTTPGLSSCLNRTCLSALLTPLLAAAGKAVPRWQHISTPLAIRATAGLRLLPEEQAAMLVQETRGVFKAYDFQDAGVKVMSGEDEGSFQWIAVNSLLGALRPGAAPAVVLDLGGGSTQIAYAVDPSQISNLSAERRAAYIRELHLPGRAATSPVYQHSYLGFGLLAMRAKMFKEAASAGISDANPCLPRLAGVEYSYYGSSYSGRGAGDAAGCAKLVARVLRPEPPCEEGQTPSEAGRCAFAGAWAGPGWKSMPASNRSSTQIAACSFFFFSLEDAGAISAGTKRTEATPQRYAALAREACGLVREEAAERYPGISAERAGWMCHDLTYLFVLLTVGFGFEDDRKLVAVKEIAVSSGRSYAASWTLGVALEQVAKRAQRL